MKYSAFREGERSGWSKRAEIYGNTTARATLQSIPKLLDHAKLFPGSRVLDAGCGTGHVAACAKLLGANVEGVDFAPGMVTQASQLYPEINFSIADVEDLPAAAQTYDAVLSNIVLFHVTDPERAISEARRVLRPNGRFVFSQWLGPNRSECYRLLFDVLGKHADMSCADPAPNAYILSDETSVSQLMQSVGFSDIKSSIVENVLHAPGPSFFDFFMDFGVRVPLIVERQEPDVKSIIRREIDEATAQYLFDGVYKIPMPSIVYSGCAG